MPLCDWTKVNPGLFHHFHQRWIGEITDSLNAGRLPADLYALVEQFAGGLHPNSEIEGYAAKASSIVVHQVRGNMIAAIEIVSPGNKSIRAAVRSFVARTAQCLRNGVHVLVIDLFPPTYGSSGRSVLRFRHNAWTGVRAFGFRRFARRLPSWIRCAHTHTV